MFRNGATKVKKQRVVKEEKPTFQFLKNVMQRLKRCKHIYVPRTVVKDNEGYHVTEVYCIKCCRSEEVVGFWEFE